MNYDPRLQELMNNTHEIGQKAGYTFPDSMKDPQEIVQHLIMTGQISNPLLQRIMPMIQRMNGK